MGLVTRRMARRSTSGMRCEGYVAEVVGIMMLRY